MTSQSHTILLLKIVGGFLLVEVVLQVLSHFKDDIRRLNLLEGLLLGAFLFIGILLFFKWIVNKHFRDY